jgi:hypothetical protein
MTFFKEVENSSLVVDRVPALGSYMPNSVIYVVLYLIALPPNILLAYMGAKPGLINSVSPYLAPFSLLTLPINEQVF